MDNNKPWLKWPNIPCGENDAEYRGVMHSIIQGINDENLRLISYLCKDIISQKYSFASFIELLRHFETCKKIGCHNVSLLAEILYRISRRDLLKKLMNMSVQRFEDEYLRHYYTHFTPFRVIMFELHDDLGACDFTCLKHQFSAHMKRRSIDETPDVISLLIKIEELGVVDCDDFSDLVSVLRLLDNPEPFEKFQRLTQNDWSVVLPEKFQVRPRVHGPIPFNSESPIAKKVDFDFQRTETYKAIDPIEDNNDSKVRYELSPQGDLEFRSRQPAKVNNNARTKLLPQQNEIEVDKKHPTYGLQYPKQEQAQHEYYRHTNFGHSSSMPVLHDNVRSSNSHNFVPSLSYPRMEQISNYPITVQTSQFAQQKTEHLSHEIQMLTLTDYKPHTESYKMDSKPLGICLIINNEIFEKQYTMKEDYKLQQSQGSEVPRIDLENRVGSSVDAASLKDLFQEGFAFKVHQYDNLKFSSMMKTLEDYAKLDHSTYDCFVCIILSHGKRNIVYSTDGYKVRISDIQGSFTTTTTLVDKPKLFFIQACAGTKEMPSQAIQPSQDQEIQQDGAGDQTSPLLADFLLAHATSPGYVSYRSITNGSWFISALTNNLKRYCGSDDLLSIIVRTNNEVSRNILQQVPMPYFTLRRKVYFTMLPEYVEKVKRELANQNPPTVNAIEETL